MRKSPTKCLTLIDLYYILSPFMENSDKLQTLDNLLLKVKQLRGYGDMNSFKFVNDLKDFEHVLPELPIQYEHIIEDLASPQTWNKGKKTLEKNVEHAISATHENNSYK